MPRRRKSQQAEREYEKIKSQLEGLEESVRDRCKKEFTGRGRSAAAARGWCLGSSCGGNAVCGVGIRAPGGQGRLTPASP